MLVIPTFIALCIDDEPVDTAAVDADIPPLTTAVTLDMLFDAVVDIPEKARFHADVKSTPFIAS